jgi:DNA replication protein DnaC
MTAGTSLERGVRIKTDSALNTPFSDWGNILFNTTIATAIADRLVENSEIFLLGGDSLRKPNKNPIPPAEES